MPSTHRWLHTFCILLSGFAHHPLAQAKEEMGHAIKMFTYISDGGAIQLLGIPRLKSGWESVVEAIEDFYNSEVTNTKRIWGLVESAGKARDETTVLFLK